MVKANQLWDYQNMQIVSRMPGVDLVLDCKVSDGSNSLIAWPSNDGQNQLWKRNI